MKAGFGKVRITPQVGAPLTGYRAREGVSEGIHDDLWVRVAVLEDGGAALALVSVEVLALDENFVRASAAAITEATGIPSEGVLIAATHTHAGPVTIRTFFNPDEKLDAGYMEQLKAAITASVRQAWMSRVPARVGVGTAQASIGANRRDPEAGPVDREVGIIRVDEEESGQILGVVVNYTCHPTILGANNRLVTGDFPAMMLERVEQGLPAGACALFFNGALGNISVGHSSELSAIGVITPGRTFERARQLGDQLGDVVLGALPGIATSTAAELRVVTLTLDLPTKSFPGLCETGAAVEAAERRLVHLASAGAEDAALRKARVDLLYATIDQGNARELAQANGSLPIRLQGLRIDGSVLVAVPGELFVEIGLTIKRRAPHRTFIIGLANGYIGYVPTREACEEGGYETSVAVCGPDAERILVEAALELDRRLLAVE